MWVLWLLVDGSGGGLRWLGEGRCRCARLVDVLLGATLAHQRDGAVDERHREDADGVGQRLGDAAEQGARVVQGAQRLALVASGDEG